MASQPSEEVEARDLVVENGLDTPVVVRIELDREGARVACTGAEGSVRVHAQEAGETVLERFVELPGGVDLAKCQGIPMVVLPVELPAEEPGGASIARFWDEKRAANTPLDLTGGRVWLMVGRLSAAAGGQAAGMGARQASTLRIGSLIQEHRRIPRRCLSEARTAQFAWG